MATPTASTVAPAASDRPEELAAPTTGDEGLTRVGATWPETPCSEGLQEPLNLVPCSAFEQKHVQGRMATLQQASGSGPPVTNAAGQGARTWEHDQASAAAATAAAAAATATAAAATAAASVAAAAAAAVASASAAAVHSPTVGGDVRVTTSSAVAETATESGKAASGLFPGCPTTFAAEGKGVDAGAGAAVSPPSLAAWLKEGPFVLSMSPGFFGFYAHIGALIALEDAGLLEGVSFATGASAGGLIAGLFAAGLSPAHMGETVVKFRRSDFWDPFGFGGLLRGKKFEDIVNGTLPAGVRRFDQCRVPLAVSAFDVSRLTTRTLEEGHIAPALRATCTFPGLFAPVWHERGVLVDGGVRDTSGMWSVPEGREDCRRILNVTFGHRDGKGVCVPPSSFPTASNPRPATDGMEIVSLPLTGLPRPHPFAMERGADAMEAARSQVAAVLGAPLLEGNEASHWVAATEAATVETPPPPPTAAANQEGLVSTPGATCVANDGDAAVSGGESSTNGPRKRADVGAEVNQASSSGASGDSAIKVGIKGGLSRGGPDVFGTRSSAPAPATNGGAGQATSACDPTHTGGFAMATGSTGLHDRGGREGMAAKAEPTSPSTHVGRSEGSASPFTTAKVEVEVGTGISSVPHTELDGRKFGGAPKRGHQPSCDAREEGKVGVSLALQREQVTSKKLRLSGETGVDDRNAKHERTTDDATPGDVSKVANSADKVAASAAAAADREGHTNAGGAASDDPDAADAPTSGGLGEQKRVPTPATAGARAQESLKRAAPTPAGRAEGEKSEAGAPLRTSKRARRPKILYPIEL